ncbi:MAG: beta-ketoacyl reductase, partial [Burkholderiaceae bacterium]
NPPAGREIFAAIEAAGARVLPIRADVADATALADAIALLSRDAPPLRGVIHAAAALSAAPIGRLGAARLREMLRPKVDGTVALQRATANAGLDFLVLFSSTTALLGASGLAHYAAANAFLDATAHGFDAPDRRVISVDWGTWDTMRLASDDDRRAYLAGGLRPMATSLALEALGRLLGTDRPQTVVAAVDWAALRALHESRRRRPLLESLGVAEPVATTAAEGAAVATAELMTRLARLQSTQRLDALVDFVESQVVAVLGLDRGSPVALDTGLFDLGMDSLMAVELKRRLEQGVGLPLPSTLTFNYPNVRALAGFLDRSVRPTLPGAVEPGSGAGSSRAATSGGAAAVALSAPAVEAERAAASLDADLDSLTEEELEARLMARLERTR